MLSETSYTYTYVVAPSDAAEKNRNIGAQLQSILVHEKFGLIDRRAVSQHNSVTCEANQLNFESLMLDCLEIG